jgi:hypothetical protein
LAIHAARIKRDVCRYNRAMVRGVALLSLVAACGRFDFDPLADAATSTLPACPDGYAAVAGDASLGSSAFCAMRFEAKARSLMGGAIAAAGCDATCSPNSLVATHAAASAPEGHPWIEIDAVHARERCRALGDGHDLMSNLEWMTIARDAELVGANWSSGIAGAGRMVEGATDGDGNGAVSDPEDPYSDTGNSAADPPGAGWEQRRTLELSTGDVLWDLPGNVQEWVDWTLGDALDGAPTPCAGNELPAFTCPGIAYDQFNSRTGTYDSTNGVGRVLGGAGDATRRGGQRSDRSLGYAGIYALNMNRFAGDVFPATGFRCVYRP